MAHYFKNRITFYFDDENETSFRIYFATLEQVNTFIHYWGRCLSVPYSSYTREVCKNNNWTTTYTQKASRDEILSEKRMQSAPYRLNITLWEKGNRPEFYFSMYFFSSIDLDFIGALLTNGIQQSQVGLVAQNKDRDTGEWVDRELSQFIPQSVATLYKQLDQKGKELAQAEMFKLKTQITS